MAGSTEPPFRVIYSGAVRESLQQLADRARQRGVGAAFLSALQIIDERLGSDPFQFGEPRFRLENLHLQVRIAVVSPLAVAFAVHETQPIVFTREFRLLKR